MSLLAVAVLNLILRLGFRFEGVPVTIGIAAAVAFLSAGWFAKSIGRAPLPEERSRFLWLYGCGVALLFLAIVAIASLRSVPSFAGLFILFLHYLSYPAFAQMAFSEKNFGKIFHTKT